MEHESVSKPAGKPISYPKHPRRVPWSLTNSIPAIDWPRAGSPIFLGLGLVSRRKMRRHIHTRTKSISYFWPHKLMPKLQLKCPKLTHTLNQFSITPTDENTVIYTYDFRMSSLPRDWEVQSTPIPQSSSSDDDDVKFSRS
jgi:hypothetical protein